MPIESSSYNQGTMHYGFQSNTASVSIAADLASSGHRLSGSGEWHGVATASDAQYPHTALASTCVRLTVATCVQIDAFL